MDKNFIWPENKIRLQRFLNLKFYIPKTYRIEEKLQEMFPSGSAVLCSSGRAAINIALESLNQKRPDMIGTNTYTSHCVLDAISRIATPIKWDSLNKDIKTRLIYHQWGYVQKESIDIDTIDDCVDSLCELGTELFPTSKNFEIWSLPKILGTSSGAVLWCKDPKVAENIRIFRNKRGGGIFCWILRIIGFFSTNFYWLWQGIEPQKGKLSIMELLEINNAIKQWDRIVKDRKTKLDLLWQFAPKWIDKPSLRLPCVIPLEFVKYTKIKEFRNLKIEIKHFEKKLKNQEINLIKVLPLPIHQDVSLNSLIAIKNELMNLNN